MTTTLVTARTENTEAFRAAMSAAGISPPPSIVEDGRIHRFSTTGQLGDRSGWYVYHSDNVAAGAFGDFRLGVSETWSTANSSTLTPEDRQAHQQRLDLLRQQREEEEARGHEEAAAWATEIWESSQPASPDHPYLRRKSAQVNHLRMFRGELFIGGSRLNGALILPLYDANGKLYSLEFICTDGTKRFLPGGRKRGCFSQLGEIANTVYLGEGYATASSVHQATGLPVVIAFDAGNLKPVAEAIRSKYPSTQIVVCGDNDVSETGQKNARDAAQAVNGVPVIPEATGDDWNDVHQRDGLEVVRRSVHAIPHSTISKYAHLLDGPETPPAPRLPQEFRGKHLSYGVTLDGQPYVIRGDRTIVPAEEFGAENYGLANVRFSKGGIKRFLNGETITGAALFERLQTFLRRFVVMGEDLLALLTLWLIATYLYMVFEYFPYWVARSPEKRCGKSRLLDLIAMLAFNAHQPTASPTEAQIFREPREDGGVQVYDEMEGMAGDKERWSVVNSVLNSGFHKGQRVTRYRKTSQGQQKEVFETYVPRAIASISSLETTLEDRSIMIMMQRLLPGQQTERFSLRRLDSEAQALRDDLYLFGLTTAPTIAELYDGSEFPGLSNLDHRAVDLWEPLLSVAAVIDASGGTGTLTDRMTKLAERLGGDRAARSADDPNPIIIEVLEEYLTLGTEARVRADDLAEKVRQRLGWDSLTSKALANRLHPLGLKSTRWREGKENRRGYVFSRAQIDDLTLRYTSGNLEHPEHGTPKQ